MLALKIIRCCTFTSNRRLINQSARRLDTKASDSTTKASSATSTTSSSSSDKVRDEVLGPRMMAPSDFDKWILVWVKRFPSKDQVPSRITYDTILAAKSRARVKTCHYMMGLTIIGCFLAVISGKRAAKSGDSIEKRHEELHRKAKEEYQATLKAKADTS